MTETVLPVVDDLDTGGFFAAAAEGRLVVRHCTQCGATLHMPREYCNHCGSFEGEWRTVAPTGTVYSYIVVTHQVNPAFPVPHTILLVELDEEPGVRLIGRLDGRPDVRIGQRVVAEFEQHDNDVALPNWRLA